MSSLVLLILIPIFRAHLVAPPDLTPLNKLLLGSIDNKPLINGIRTVNSTISDDTTSDNSTLDEQNVLRHFEISSFFPGAVDSLGHNSNNVRERASSGIVFEIITAPNATPGAEEALLNRSSVLFVAVSFILLMAISLAWLVFYYVQRFRYLHSKERVSRRLAELAKKAVARIPVKILRPGDQEINSETEHCAICIELFRPMDNIRILPCRHYFHKSCIDPWLLEQRSCPMCKLDILQVYELRSELFCGCSNLEHPANRPINSVTPTTNSVSFSSRPGFGEERVEHFRLLEEHLQNASSDILPVQFSPVTLPDFTSTDFLCAPDTNYNQLDLRAHTSPKTSTNQNGLSMSSLHMPNILPVCAVTSLSSSVSQKWPSDLSFNVNATSENVKASILLSSVVTTHSPLTHATQLVMPTEGIAATATTHSVVAPIFSDTEQNCDSELHGLNYAKVPACDGSNVKNRQQVTDHLLMSTTFVKSGSVCMKGAPTGKAHEQIVPSSNAQCGDDKCVKDVKIPLVTRKNICQSSSNMKSWLPHRLQNLLTEQRFLYRKRSRAHFSNRSHTFHSPHRMSEISPIVPHYAVGNKFELTSSQIQPIAHDSVIDRIVQAVVEDLPSEIIHDSSQSSPVNTVNNINESTEQSVINP